MFGELIYLACNCGESLRDEDGVLRVFWNHSEAIRAGNAEGWTLLSDSLGGDKCPDCSSGWSKIARLIASKDSPHVKAAIREENVEAHLRALSRIRELDPGNNDPRLGLRRAEHEAQLRKHGFEDWTFVGVDGKKTKTLARLEVYKPTEETDE